MTVATVVKVCAVSSLVALSVACSKNTEPATEKAIASEKPVDTVAAAEAAVPENPLKEAYFGEIHMHTSYSLDSYIGGNRRTPDDAYRFARGEVMDIHGDKHQLKRPLDFAAVTDHAEFIGEMYSAQVEGAPGYDNPTLVELRGLNKVEDQRAWFVKYVVKNNRSSSPQHPPFYAGEATTKSAWAMNFEVTNKYYQPGKFTTLHGFEWTAAPNGGNMHRNIIFRDNNVPELPFSNVDSSDEEKLWDWIDLQRSKGMTLFAVPHNSNGSKGQMFESIDNSGKPLDTAYAKRRESMEPLIEMMQIKGNSEVTRQFWPNDEFANFENADSLANFSERVKRKDNYVRYAVIKGTHFQKTLGANPFKFGIVGGTDNHNSGMGDVDEDNYIGSHGPTDGTVDMRRTSDIDGWIRARESSPGALTGVWAPKNTRAEIWDALAARETFGTSGPRIRVRMFAGSDLPANPADAEVLVTEGYAKGVPMGSTLTALSKAPTFTVYAEKDSLSGNLDRLQIIKGWADDKGDTQEKIINVVWAGERQQDADGKLPAVGNTVDLKTATYTNDIGASMLMGSWTDNDFDPQQHAVYYARVLEIPTPRWSTYDAVRNKLPLLDDVPAIVQERAWTSPIWYTAQ
ncbi:DUF3604 domain-containing protein [Oceanicoccus sagamiensis]|uniref:DUF3604 domain-containing protein n=1 Tax=Oceanicoccus sagamiensis TaxID=716816 RepID=A0A1X9N8L5_9GAMM|nr:DUF3604 domain-containing protein [Oceanicoccus sagamiensis]ARN73511.1 hypothetical protein BST96_04890 [Oceanicoccus sagamiensis]